MDEKTLALFKFLQANRSYNLAFQKAVLSSWIEPFKSEREKAYSVLLNVYKTQARPSLDKASNFLEPILYSNKILNSFTSFANYLGANDVYNFKNCFSALKNAPGWGNKTSALLLKILYQISHHTQLRSLIFWKDTPSLKSNDTLYLPVDQVILEIFRYIDKSKNSFGKINSYLCNIYSPREIEIWDDLWFWGYFNQRGAGFNRTLGFNNGKYWISIYTNKSEKIINELKEKGKIFTSILTA